MRAREREEAGATGGRDPRASRRGGFTLAEVVVVMGVMAVLLGGISSVILIASHALPDEQDPLFTALESAEVIDEMARDLSVALTFTERTPTAVTFTVPDRDGDASPESIRYAWTGTPGDPLTRQYNGAAAVNVIGSVAQYALTYDYKKDTTQTPAAPNESAEMLLFSNDALLDLGDFRIDGTAEPGQYFLPSLPADAVSWKVTRVKLLAKKDGKPKGQTRVQLRPATGGNLPQPTVLEEQIMDEALLVDSYMWREFTFTNVSGISPGAGLCLVLEYVSDAHSAAVQYRKLNAAIPNAAFIQTLDGGTTWTANSGGAMQLYVWGTVTTAGAPVAVDTYYLTGIRIELEAAGGSNAGAPFETGVQVLNAPQVPGI